MNYKMKDNLTTQFISEVENSTLIQKLTQREVLIKSP